MYLTLQSTKSTQIRDSYNVFDRDRDAIPRSLFSHLINRLALVRLVRRPWL